MNFDFQLLAAPRARVRKATGAGDALVGALVWATAVRGARMPEALGWGLAAAHAALEHEPAEGAAGGAVPAGLCVSALQARRALIDAIEEEYT